jgi:energy-coupling factor transporter ATP-binding protein EcfA2
MHAGAVNLDVADLSYRYEHAAADAVSSVTMYASGGEIIGLLGENGAGKSTILRLISGLLMPRGGGVLINGRSPATAPPRDRILLVRMSLQTPEHQLFRTSVRAELEFDARAQGVESGEYLPRAARVLEPFGLGDVMDEHPYDLDPWARKVVTVASALASHAPVVTLDEPTNRLDQRDRAVLAGQIRVRADAGGIVILSSHDAEFCAATCTHLAWMRRGQLSERIPAAEVWRAQEVGRESSIWSFPGFYLRRAVGRGEARGS